MKARAQILVDGRISEAEALWYDTSRWPTFVEGFHHVASRDPAWPEAGEMVWDSVPNGRGRVMEKVTRFEPRVGQWAQIEDSQIRGNQTVTFAVAPGERVRIALDLSYEVKERRGGPLFSIVDALFIRPRQREALARTLVRFSRELAAERAALGGT